MHLFTFAIWTLCPVFPFAKDPPASTDCHIAPATISNFYWHNSTHNCGCDDGRCLPTGLPAPPGCGPPDILRATFYEPTFDYNVTCLIEDPGSVPALPIPGGWYNCRSLGRHFSFAKNGEVATITYVEPNGHCLNGRWEVTYSGSFKMGCDIDVFGNTSCFSDHGTLPPVGFSFGGQD